MDEEGGSGPEKGRRWILGAVCAVILIIIILFAGAFICGMSGSCCYQVPRITAATGGDAVIVTCSGGWSGHGGAWSAKRLPKKERLPAAFHYQVKLSDGTGALQDLPAPGQGKDQTVRFDHAATAGREHVFVTFNYSDGTTQVVYVRNI